MHVVTFQDFEKVVRDIDDAWDMKTDALERFLEKIAIIREIDPNNISPFTFRELLLYNGTTVLMACLPYLREVEEDGSVGDDCDTGPATEYLGEFHREEGMKLLTGQKDLLSPFDLNYDGTGPDELLSDEPALRTKQLSWLLERCGDNPAEGLGFYIRECGDVFHLDIGNVFLEGECRHKRFYRCRFDVGDDYGFSGCEFIDCEIVDLPEMGLWGCTFVRPKGRTPAVVAAAGRGNLVMEQARE